jgi:hypothetical protein
MNRFSFYMILLHSLFLGIATANAKSASTNGVNPEVSSNHQTVLVTPRTPLTTSTPSSTLSKSPRINTTILGNVNIPKTLTNDVDAPAATLRERQGRTRRVGQLTNDKENINTRNNQRLAAGKIWVVDHNKSAQPQPFIWVVKDPKKAAQQPFLQVAKPAENRIPSLSLVLNQKQRMI